MVLRHASTPHSRFLVRYENNRCNTHPRRRNIFGKPTTFASSYSHSIATVEVGNSIKNIKTIVDNIYGHRDLEVSQILVSAKTLLGIVSVAVSCT